MKIGILLTSILFSVPLVVSTTTYADTKPSSEQLKVIKQSCKKIAKLDSKKNIKKQQFNTYFTCLKDNKAYSAYKKSSCYNYCNLHCGAYDGLFKAYCMSGCCLVLCEGSC